MSKKYVECEDLKQVIKANDWSNPAVPNVVNMIIDRTPGADVKEVIHAEWVDDMFGQGDVICSNCKNYPHTDEDGNPISGDFASDFCPNCGAQMY